jgi:hypothetical protein
MELYSIDVTPQEIAFLRQSLDVVSISGKDAKFISGLQTKLENEMMEIQQAKEQQKFEAERLDLLKQASKK